MQLHFHFHNVAHAFTSLGGAHFGKKMISHVYRIPIKTQTENVLQPSITVKSICCNPRRPSTLKFTNGCRSLQSCYGKHFRFYHPSCSLCAIYIANGIYLGIQWLELLS